MIRALYLSDRALYPAVVALDPNNEKFSLDKQIRFFTDGEYCAVPLNQYDAPNALNDFIIYANCYGLFFDSMEQNMAMRPELVTSGQPFLAGILYGPVLITKHDHTTGEELTLEDDDIKNILRALNHKVMKNYYREGFLERNIQWTD